MLENQGAGNRALIVFRLNGAYVLALPRLGRIEV